MPAPRSPAGSSGARLCSFRRAWPSIARRYAALARWSSSGVPSPAITSAAARTVSADHGRPTRAASVSRARTGVAAMPPSPMHARLTTPSVTSRAKPTATLEMSSKRRLAILWNAVRGASGLGRRICVMSSPAARTLCRYPVK